MIPQETVAKILDTAKIEEVVGDFVSLKRRGADYVACCPFHNEKTPSFHVSPVKGLFKCFGCGEAGSAVGFVMKHESMTYPEALRYLARRYGIEVVEREETAEDIAARSKRESLLLVLDFAHKFFMESLKSDEGRSVGLTYFHSRGLEDSTIEKYGLGWAPKSRHALYDAAISKGFKLEYLLEVGLCIKYDNGKVVDKFFDRVMFPIHNPGGNVIGFGGRTLLNDKTVAKYVNSPQSEIYDKSHTLYGVNFAKNAIHRQDKCFLVEGYLDVLSMHQLGITNVVASSGTSLTVPQILLMKKFSDYVTIMYDGDMAGIKAALRGIDLVLKEGMKVKVVLLPDGDDPDSFSRKHNLEEVSAFIASHEQDFIEFKTDLLLSESGDDPLRKAGLINEISDTIALIPDAVTRTVYCQLIAQKFGIDSQLIFSRVRRTRGKILEDEKKALERESPQEPIIAPLEPEFSSFPPTKDTLSGTEKSVNEFPLLLAGERELLWFILNYGLEEMEFETDSVYYQEQMKPTVAAFISCNLEDEGLEFKNTVCKRAYDIYFDYYDNHPEMDQKTIVKAMADGEDRQVAELVVGIVQEKYDLTVKKFADAMTALSTQLVKFVPRSLLVYQLQVLKFNAFELNEALKNASTEKQLEILAKIQELAQKRKVLDEALGRVR